MPFAVDVFSRATQIRRKTMLKFVVALAAVTSLGLAVPAFAEDGMMAKPEMAKPHMMAKPHVMVVHHYHHHYHHHMASQTKAM
jgi:hypothetical protein